MRPPSTINRNVCSNDLVVSFDRCSLYFFVCVGLSALCL